jgi:hypothetical protein
MVKTASVWTRMEHLPLFLMAAAALAVCAPLHGQQRWSEDRANQWYQQQPWMVGANFVPSDAVNELEMWQAASFDAVEIDREFGWAEGLGMTTMRVFLHNLLWEQDAAGFKKRLDEFLAIAAKHHIRPMFVLFDSCWDPDPKLGPQRPPIPGVHNSGWVQAPGRAILGDPTQYPRLRAYVQGVVGAFANDPRVLAWDRIAQQAGSDSCFAAAGLCMGALGTSHTAADQRRLGRRLVIARKDVACSTDTD